MNLDASVQRLVEIMNNAFIFLHEAKDLDHLAIQSQKDILGRIAKQTTECAYFIRDYAKNKDFCMPLFPLISHDPDLLYRATNCKESSI